MYGNVPPDQELQKIHDKYIKTVITDYGSREAAIQGMLKTAWYSYSQNDFKTAMKRFNQVWLLDQNNAQVFYGFGLLMDRRGKADDAIAFYKKSLELDPKNEKAMCYLASISFKKALQDKAYNECDKSLLLYQKAIDVTKETGRTDFIGRIYAEWAIGLYYKEDYADAWTKVKLARQHGEKINPEFLKELSSSMPESQ
jgi:tetratricopeptide (TPR) repeat protein